MDLPNVWVSFHQGTLGGVDETKEDAMSTHGGEPVEYMPATNLAAAEAECERLRAIIESTRGTLLEFSRDSVLDGAELVPLIEHLESVVSTS